MSQIQIPKGWTLEKLENVCKSIKSGGTPSRNISSYFGGNIPWVKMADLKTDYILDTEEKLTLEGLENSSAKLFPKDTVLLAMYTYDMGKTAILRIEAATNQAICGLECSERIIPKFLYYYLRGRQNEIRKIGSGGAQPNINQGKVKSLEIPLPSVEIQKKIVSKLDHVFLMIEDKKRQILKFNTRQITEFPTKYFKYVLSDVYSGHLTKNWRISNPHIKSSGELLQRITEKRKRDSNFDNMRSTVSQNLHELPPTWVWTTIGTLFEVKPGSTPSRTMSEYWQGDISWVSSGEVANCEINSTKEKITALGIEKSSAKLHPPNTVLLAMIGQGKTRGQTAILRIPAATNQNVAAILCAHTPISSEYIFYWLLEQYEETRSVGWGGNQKAMNADHVKKIPIPLAPLEEQNEIIKIIKERKSGMNLIYSRINTITTIKDKMLKELDQIKSSILDLTFAGKLIN